MRGIKTVIPSLVLNQSMSQSVKSLSHGRLLNTHTDDVRLRLTRREGDHPEPGESHQGVVEPVADGRAHAGQQAGADVLDGQPRGHVWGVDCQTCRQSGLRSRKQTLPDK